MRRVAAVSFVLLAAAACGKTSSPGTSSGTPTPTAVASPTPAQMGGGPEGVWSVKGSDSRGAYTGQIEVKANGDHFDFTRVIRYDSLTVEDSRELWWVFQGSLAKSADALDTTFSLKRADFVKSRDALTRTIADGPVAGTGHFTPVAGGWSGTWAGAGEGTDTWSGLAPSGAAPIFTLERTLVPGHDAADANTYSTMWNTFASFRALPDVQPYVNDPRFIAAIHGFWIDRTDFDFYQSHPTALRVVNKVIDPISLLETKMRADAFRWKLSEKAAYFDQVTKDEFIDPVANTLVDSKDASGLVPTGDGALWTSTWIAAQAYRYEVTGETEAMNNVAKSIDAIDTMVEITGDPTTFARTLRPATGAASGNWHQGTGGLSYLDWQEGGNNDMFKGLLYGNLMAWITLCETPSGHDAACARIDATVRRMADDLTISQAHGTNRLMAQWLAALVTGESGYLGNAESEWLLQAETIKNGNAMIYSQGIADWSGTHLGFCTYAMLGQLQDRLDLGFLGNDPGPKIAAGVDTSKGYFARQHMGLWSIAFAALGTTPDSTQIDDVKWRLREITAPKFEADVDHRIDPDFVLSPYPSLPWKGDWTTTDRTQSLNGYPLFEQQSGVYAWKDSPLHFRTNTVGAQHPGADYSHAYWLARHLGILDASN